MTRIDDLYNDIGAAIDKWPRKILKTPFFREMIHDARVIIDKADDILNG